MSPSNKRLTFVRQRAMRPAFAEHVPLLFQVVRSISTTIQMAILVMVHFKVWMAKIFSMLNFPRMSVHAFISPLQNMAVIDAEREGVIPAVSYSIRTVKLITWRRAFLGGRHGLGVFHCAHS